MKANPPIKGHRLLHEGHSVRKIDPATDMYDGWEEGCECGAKPDTPYSPSINEMKRWHRSHKEQLRSTSVGFAAAADPDSAARPIPQPPGDRAGRALQQVVSDG